MFSYLLRETQVHGGRRLAEKRFRCWWSLGLLVLFGLSVAVVSVTIQRFLSNPTFILQKEMVKSTWEFPSVIVCPEIMFPLWKINQFLKNVKIPPNLNTTYVKSTINQLAAFFSSDVLYNTQDLQNLESLLEYNAMDVKTAGQLLTGTCEETLIRCRWNGEIVNCSGIFQMELTGVGFCCVFNGRSIKRRFENHKNEKYYTTRYAGFTSGLMLAINQSQKPDNVDLSYKWVALQSSHHFVESSVNGTPLSPGAEQWAALRVHSLQIEEDARSLSDRLKGCRMRSDALEYFPYYYRRYCLVECEMHRALRWCKCVLHVHPLPEGAQYCRAHSLRCAQHARVTYEHDNDQCNCPSACDVASDYVTTLSFQLLPGSHPVDAFYEGLNFSTVTIVRAYLENRKLRTNIRRSYFNRTDLFAQLGGVFNLFFGCSILTLLELAVLGFEWLKQIGPCDNYSKTFKLKEEQAKNKLQKLERKENNKRVEFIKTIS